VQSIPYCANKRILEVGCGTGAFTKEILKKLQEGDEFHIVELSSDFCAKVEKSLLQQFRKDNPDIKVEVHNALIEEAKLEGEFDAIICGLPFNNFPLQVVEHVFEVMLGFLRSGRELTYFEYLGIRKLKRVFGLPAIRRETKQRTENIDARFEKQSGSQERVWRNIPSCRVVRLTKC